jgi:uncharacterized protein YheU (UPF0270 family)
MIIIPIKEVEPVLLRKIAASFVMREGTDYGSTETNFEDKINQVLSQLQKGEAVLSFDLQSETINILAAKEAKGLIENYDPERIEGENEHLLKQKGHLSKDQSKAQLGQSHHPSQGDRLSQQRTQRVFQSYEDEDQS